MILTSRTVFSAALGFTFFLKVFTLEGTCKSDKSDM